MKNDRIFAMLLSLAVASGLVACSDDDAALPMLDKPTVEATQATYNSLTFEWEKVKGAVQYGYQLLDSEKTVETSGVITAPKISFSNLKDDSEYTLRVWPFAGLNVDYSTPAPVEISAKTDAIIKLDSPVVTVEIEDNKAVINWTKIENAESYSYVLYKNGEQFRKATISTLRLTVRNLEPAEYLFTVQAVTTVGGYSDSDIVSETFTIEDEEANKAWSAAGSYYNDYDYTDYDATLIYNEDGTFTIPAFHGNEGFDLSFKLNEDGEVVILSGEAYSSSYQSVPTGPDDFIYVYLAGGGYGPEFTGDKNGGDFWFGYYDSEWNDDWYVDEFTWGTTTRSISQKHLSAPAVRK